MSFCEVKNFDKNPQQPIFAMSIIEFLQINLIQKKFT